MYTYYTYIMVMFSTLTCVGFFKLLKKMRFTYRYLVYLVLDDTYDCIQEHWMEDNVACGLAGKKKRNIFKNFNPKAKGKTSRHSTGKNNEAWRWNVTYKKKSETSQPPISSKVKPKFQVSIAT